VSSAHICARHYQAGSDVRFTPNSDRLLRCREMTLCANTDQSAPQQNRA
jgi:hypothetical protein